MHESFRKAELQALAELANVELEILRYSEDVRVLNCLDLHLFSFQREFFMPPQSVIRAVEETSSVADDSY